MEGEGGGAGEDVRGGIEGKVEMKGKVELGMRLRCKEI